jgi:replicative DNA helicase
MTNVIADFDAQKLLAGAGFFDSQIRALIADLLPDPHWVGKAYRELIACMLSDTKLLPSELSKEANQLYTEISAQLLGKPDIEQVLDAIKRMKDRTAVRRLDMTMKSQIQAVSAGATADEIGKVLLTEIVSSAKTIATKNTFTARDVVSAGQKLRESWESGDPYAGLKPTYIKELDEKLGGFVPGAVTVFGGRPSQGKTAMALQIFRNTVLKAKNDGRDSVSVFVSLDATHTTLGFRMASSISSVNMDDVRLKRASPNERERFWDEHAKMDNWPMVIKDMPQPTSQEVLNSIEIEAAGHKDGVDLIVIDFIELMSGKGSNETAMVSNIIIGTKVIAKHFNCPVLALSQLSRKVEELPDKMPEKYHLRQSGMIEAIAEQVCLCYYPEGYRSEVDIMRDQWPNEMLHKQYKGLAALGGNFLLKVEKNKERRSGLSVILKFVPEFMRFEGPSKEQKPLQQATYAAHTAKEDLV